jgi:putative intracellular protease/amidase
MQRGLEGRRIALFAAGDDDRVAVVTRALEGAGAPIHVLKPGEGEDEDWHGARYAALVIIGDSKATFTGEPQLVQLAREFLVSDKPLAVFGSAVMVLLESGGAAGRSMAADGDLKSALEEAGGTCVDEPIHEDESLITAAASANIEEFAKRVVSNFSERLEERATDEMSELSFPASDPPAVAPSTVGRVSPDSDARS